MAADPNKQAPKQDDLVAKLVKDAQAPPDALLLSGYIGTSSEEGHTRCYFDPQLSDYVEIPNDAILHTQEIPKDHSPLGGTLIWIKRDAVLTHGKVGPNRLKAKFLEGRIQQEFVKAQAAAGVPGQPGVPIVTLPDAPGCQTQFGPACHTLTPGAACPTAICTHIGPACQTHQPPCTVTGPTCPTHQLECTRLGPNCPTLVHTVCTCAGPACPTHQPPCTIIAPGCQTLSPTIIQCCQPSLVHTACTCAGPTCPTHQPGCTVTGLTCPTHLHNTVCTCTGPTCHTVGATVPIPCCQIETIHQPLCTAAGPECPPVGSGPFCGGGVGGSAACGVGGGPVAQAQAYAATMVCTHTGVCGGTQQHPVCTIGGQACGITLPQQCPIQSAFCPTQQCPTQQFCPTQFACTIGGQACGITLPQQCPIQSAFCPQSAFAPCFTQNQPACHLSVAAPCQTINQPACHVSLLTPCFTHNQPACHLSVAAPCQTINQPACHHSVFSPCITSPQIPCPPPAGGGGVPQPAVAGMQAAAPALHVSVGNVCLLTVVGCFPTQQFLQCHPTIFCPVQTLSAQCLQPTIVGCPFPTMACPSLFCPTLACGPGGFGGGGIGQ